jgi:hypothetical protein
MKKFLIIAVVLLLCSTLQAQFIKSIGFKIGGTSSQQKHSYQLDKTVIEDNPDCKIGYNFGVFGEFLNNPVLSLIAEMNYVEKGFQRELELTNLEHPDGTGEKIILTAGINYFNFSALAKARLQGNFCTPYVFLGPKLDIELNKSDDSPMLPGMENFNKVRFGFKAGMGTEIYLFGITFLAEVIYDKDLGYLYKNDRFEITTSAIDFRGGVSISL